MHDAVYLQNYEKKKQKQKLYAYNNFLFIMKPTNLIVRGKTILRHLHTMVSDYDTKYVKQFIPLLRNIGEMCVIVHNYNNYNLRAELLILLKTASADVRICNNLLIV